MSLFLLRGNAAPETRSAIEIGLMATISGLVEISNFEGIFERTPVDERNEPATVLVVAPHGDTGYFDRLIDIAAQYRNEIFLILISEEISASDYKRLVRTGGADWVSARAGPGEVADIIARQRQQTRRVSDVSARSAAAAAPVTVSFVPSAGGVGNTTLAIESAICLKTDKQTRNRNICIVDLDFQTSHLCDHLDAEPRLHIEEFSQDPGRLDEHLFESFKTHHRSGLDVFAAPRSKFASEGLNINALDVLFSMIAKHYSLVFIDFPVTWLPWTAQVIAASDGALITGLNTIPNLRQISEALAVVRTNAPSLQIGVILNRCDRTIFGSVVRRKHVERVLHKEKVFYISNLPEAVDSVNMGVPIILGSSAGKVRKEIAELANFCAGLRSSRSVAV